MNKKQYISPRTEVLAVRVENCLQYISPVETEGAEQDGIGGAW